MIENERDVSKFRDLQDVTLPIEIPTGPIVTFEELEGLFRSLASDKFDESVDALIYFFTFNEYRLDDSLLVECVLPFYSDDPRVTEEHRLRISDLLVLLIRDQRNRSLPSFLVQNGLVTRLFQLIPTGGSLIVLYWLARTNKIAATEISTQVILDKLSPLLTAEGPHTGEAIQLLSMWRGRKSDAAVQVLTPTFKTIATLMTTSSNQFIISSACYAFGVLCRRRCEYFQILLESPNIGTFMCQLSLDCPDVLLRFLDVLELAYSNSQWNSKTNRYAVHSLDIQVKLVLIPFLRGLLTCDNPAFVWKSACILSKIVFELETVVFCLGNGFHGILFEWMNRTDEFQIKTQMVRAICSLVAFGDLSTTKTLVGCGFMGMMETYMESMSMVIPRELCAAIGALLYLAEVNTINEWIEWIVTTDSIYSVLEDLANYTGPDFELDSLISEGLEVWQDADLIVSRVQDFL